MTSQSRFMTKLARRPLAIAALTVGLCASAPPGRAEPVGTADPQLEVEAPQPQLADQPSLSDYLQIAAERSPSLRATYHRWRSALEQSGYVGALPNPTFSYTYFVTPVETRVGPQNQRLSFRQPIPWFGTLGARKSRAVEAANAAYEAFRAEQLKLSYRVKAAYHDYYYLGREIDITRTNLELLQFWESVVRVKYQVEISRHTDVIKAQVELGKLEDRLLSLEDRVAPAEARLRAILDLKGGGRLPIPDSIGTVELDVDRDSVFRQALEENPDLRSLSFLIESRRAGVAEAGKASWPNLQLGVDYIETGSAVAPGVTDSGKDPFMVSAALTLPIWFNANKSRRQEAKAKLRQSEYTYTDAQARLEELVDRVVFEYRDALRKTRLYRDGLVPKAEQSLNANYTSYQAGESDFLSVLDAQRELLEFELRLERSRSDLAIRQAELEMIAGREFSLPKE